MERAAVDHGAHRQHRVEPVAKLARKTFEHQVRRETTSPNRRDRWCNRMVLKGTMPASSQGLPTSSIREARAPHFSQRDLDGVDVGTMRRVALESIPAFHGFRFQLLAAADHREMLARAADPDGQGESPEALLRDHPVVHVAQPVQLAGFAIRRNPLDGGHHALDAVAPVHADEPFVHRTEDQLLFAAPAMRIDVRIPLARHQESGGLQSRHHLVGHLAGVASGERAEPVEENRALVERCDEREDRSRCRAADPPRRNRARCGPGRCLRPR